MVNINEKSIEKVLKNQKGSFRVLDFFEDKFLISGSTPLVPITLFIVNIKSNNIAEFQVPFVSNNQFCQEIRTRLKFESLKIHNYLSIVLVEPVLKIESQKPLILLPHGGPNSVYSEEFLASVAFLALSGYSVASSKI
jgi:dipeptidyl aminopeptidase/acylaminoacyl peptidase